MINMGKKILREDTRISKDITIKMDLILMTYLKNSLAGDSKITTLEEQERITKEGNTIFQINILLIFSLCCTFADTYQFFA